MSPLDTMRAFVAKLPDTRERAHFQDRVFCVGKKPFASCGDKGVVVQLEPEHATHLVEHDPRVKRYPRAPHCVLFSIPDVKEWKELVRASYDLVVAKAKAPKKQAARRTK